MSARRFEIYAPLQEFHWSGDDFQLAPGLWIKRFRTPPDLSGLHELIAEDEWERALSAAHWLTLDCTEAAVPSPGEIGNLVLLSLWLVKPTKSHISLRFQIGRDATDGEKTRSRLLDRFAWVPGTISPDFSYHDLQSASDFYKFLSALCSARGRLNDALLLTISGCWSHAWQVTLICHAASAEAILTYATTAGIARRLATA